MVLHFFDETGVNDTLIKKSVIEKCTEEKIDFDEVNETFAQ